MQRNLNFLELLETFPLKQSSVDLCSSSRNDFHQLDLEKKRESISKSQLPFCFLTRKINNNNNNNNNNDFSGFHGVALSSTVSRLNWNISCSWPVINTTFNFSIGSIAQQ